jgi:hypothetical protein
MFLIMSAAYVGQELQSEFGKIPPSFLPLGNKRLYQHQIGIAPKGADIFLSLPASYEIKESDQKWLYNNNVEIIKVPDGITIGASVVASINLVKNNYDAPLQIIFGDTLFNELPKANDMISVSEADSSYDWAVISDDNLQCVIADSQQNLNNKKKVVNGYFKFSDTALLIQSITASRWDFIEGINRYHEEKGLFSIQSNNWLDFGHVNTYYRSKASFTTQRSFNELTINANWIEKSSTKDLKIEAEANWFLNLPDRLKGFTPQFLGYEKKSGKTKYRLEYLHQTALNELYVFGELPTKTWKQILDSALSFLKECRKELPPNHAPKSTLKELLNDKTIKRLNEFCQKNSISLDEQWYFNDQKPVSLNNILELTAKYLPSSDDSWVQSVLHGDFCFSNILYDFRANRVKTIDPRGITESGELSIYGDIRYDLAKLSHSVIGMYDWIIAGFFDLAVEGRNIKFHLNESPNIKEVQHEFMNLIERDFYLKPENLVAMQIRLFLSMLPLHADDKRRQLGLFANSFKLYGYLKRLNR